MAIARLTFTSLLFGALLGCSALLVACDDNRLSPAGYITVYCETVGPQLGPDVDAQTIGVARSEFELLAAALEVIVPPREFEAYHQALIEFWRSYAAALAESGDDPDPFPDELDASAETERRMAIAYARMTLEFVSLPQPSIDRIQACE